MKKKGEYTLSFYEAVEKCMADQGFIRGENFAPGIYIRKDKGTISDDLLVLVDGSKHHQPIGNVFLYKGITRQ